MNQFYQAIESHLDKYDISYKVCEGKVSPYFELDYSVNNLRMNIILDQNEDHGQVFAYFISPVLIPKERRTEILELMNWLNWRRVMVGNFEMDPRDGELRARISMDIEGSELTDTMIYNIIACGIHLMDKHFPNFMEVCYGHASADDIIKRFSDEKPISQDDQEKQPVGITSIVH
jgi:hypothetical protein